MTFYTEFDPEKWLENGSNGTFLGWSTDAQEEVEFKAELGGEHQFQGYEFQTDVKENNQETSLLKGESHDIEYSEDGFLYDIEVRETVDLNEGKSARKEVDDGLLSVHFTGYRDADGEDYIVHSDPKRWIKDGKEKYPDLEGKPNVESGLQKTEEFFSEEDNYTMKDGLTQIEEYLTYISEREEGALTGRWLGLRDAVSGFKQSLEAGKPINIDRQKQNYGC